MYDVALYGHLTKDTVYTGFDVSYSLGAMANVWEAFKDIDPNFNVALCPTAMGEALIYIDKHSGTRVSKPKLNLHTREPKIVESRWNHVLYVNNLPDTSFIPQLDGPVSFDLSVGPPPDRDLLKQANYLFLSDEEEFMDFKEMCRLTRGWVILHRANGSVVSNGAATKEFATAPLQGVNVLGAGDIFTANVINNILVTGDIYNSVAEAHQATRLALSRRTS